VGVSCADRAHAVLASDGYRFMEPVPARPGDFDRQDHLNNAAIVRFFNDLRVTYVHERVGAWWPEMIRTRGYVIAARELHVQYESEGRPGEEFVGAMKYVRREGKAAILEERILERDSGRAIARAWVVQLLVHSGAVVDWPEEFFDAVAAIEGHAIEIRPRGPVIAFGPPQ